MASSSTTNKYNLAAAALGPSALFVGKTDVDGLDGSVGNLAQWNHPSMWMQEEEVWSAITPAAQQTYGATSKVQITTAFDRLGAMWLVYTRSAVTQDGGGSNKFSFHDWEPLSSLQSVVFKYVDKVFWTVRPLHLFYMIINRTPQKYKNRLALSLNGYTSTDERLANTASAITYRVPLFVPWEPLNRQLYQRSLPNVIVVEVTFNNLVDCGYVNNTGFTVNGFNGVANSICTISNINIIGEGLQKELSKKEALMLSGMNGIDFKTYDIEAQENLTLASGATSYTFDIDQIKNDTYAIYFALRPSTRVPSGSMSTTTNPYYFIKCDSFYFKDGNKNLHDTIVVADYELNKFHEIHPLAPVPNPFHIVPFCPRKFVEASDTNCYGSRALVHYNKPQLVIQFTSALGTTCRLDAYGEIHQILRVLKGTIRLYFEL